MKNYIVLLLYILMHNSNAFSQDFITTWQTDNPGVSNASSITIPTFVGETYDYNVDWDNDGTYDEFGIVGDVTHDFGVPGTYIIRIEGTFPRIYFNNSGDREKIVSINQWGNKPWTSMGSAFFGCSNLQVSATDSPILSNVTDMDRMFQNASMVNSDFNDWDTSNVTTMAALFSGAVSFNGNLNNWNVSNVTNMANMFTNATAFNQSLNNWDVSNVLDMGLMFQGATNFNSSLNSWMPIKVTNMRLMFSNAENFNQDIGGWNTGSVGNMTAMFFNALDFNQDIGTWNTSNVVNMLAMFRNAQAFNQDIGNWDVSQVTNMDNMFYDALTFNQDIGDWDTSSVTTMDNLFRNTLFFNQSLIDWNTTNVTVMSNMFNGASAFNENIGIWDTSNVTTMENMFFNASNFNRALNFDTNSVTTMRGMFYGASFFNQDISSWDVANVTNMESMFGETLFFNRDISSWTTGNVTNMRNMFDMAVAFDQNLGNWDVSNVSDMTDMFNGVTLSQENYDNMLIAWNAQNLQNGVDFNGGNSNYCNSETARDNMIVTDGWTIVDGGRDCSLSYFVTTWQTDNSGTSNDTSITIPTFIANVYNYDVDWDSDGIFDEFGITGDVTHDYGVAGTYTISIQGDFPRIYFNNEDDKDKLISIDQWGDTPWVSMRRAFQGCTNLEINATDLPDLNMVSDMSFMFEGASTLNANIDNWDVTSVTAMEAMFQGATSLNQSLGNWNVSNVTNMTNMFNGVSLSTDNYDSILIGWDAQNLQNGVDFHGGNSTYCNGEVARTNMVDTDSWTITDGGLDCSSLTINENSLDSLKIYPNPAMHTLFISGLTENAIIKISDITGKVIITTESKSIANGLNVSKLKSAMYFVTVLTKDSKSIIKIIKQ